MSVGHLAPKLIMILWPYSGGRGCAAAFQAGLCLKARAACIHLAESAMFSKVCGTCMIFALFKDSWGLVEGCCSVHAHSPILNKLEHLPVGL